MSLWVLALLSMDAEMEKMQGRCERRGEPGKLAERDPYPGLHLRNTYGHLVCGRCVLQFPLGGPRALFSF